MATNSSAKPPATNLFGEPWSELPDPRGRKRHKRSVEIAEMVAVLRGAGRTEAEIALRVDLSEPTLRKYYFRELKSGPALARAVLIEIAWAAAKEGKSWAVRFLEEQFAKGDAAIPLASPTRPVPQTQEPPAGKKAQANEAAQTAHEGTEWGNLLRH